MELYRVYIIQSAHHKRYYTGMSSNITERLAGHNDGRNTSTKNGIPWVIRWQSDTLNKSTALKLERTIKKRGAKRFLSDLGS